MSQATGRRTTPPSTTLGVVDFARHAPSLGNTQPWRWRARGDLLELYADRERQLSLADPSGRGLVISCGAALHYARVAAAVLERPSEVVPVEDRRPDHLATLRLRPGTPATAEDREAYRLLRDRHTDRRRFTSWPVPAQLLDRLARSVPDPWVRVVPVVEQDDRLRLELISREAERIEDPALGAWARQHPSAGGDEPDDVRSTDGALVLCAAEDSPPSWLAVGDVLCRVWASALQEGLALVPVYQPVAVERTRDALRELVCAPTCPELVVRIGWQEIGRSPLPPTPRRPIGDVLA